MYMDAWLGFWSNSVIPGSYGLTGDMVQLLVLEGPTSSIFGIVSHDGPLPPGDPDAAAMLSF